MSWAARVEDVEQAARLVTECGYYGSVAPADLAGVPLYGIQEEGELLACVAVIAQGAQAYLDYLVVRQDVRNKGLAAELLDWVYQDLACQGVRMIHTCVSGENGAAAKLLIRFGAKIGWPYINGLVSIEEL